MVTHRGKQFMKGFQVYKKIDDLLEKSYWKNKINLPMTFTQRFKFKNVKVMGPLNQKDFNGIPKITFMSQDQFVNQVEIIQTKELYVDFQFYI